MSFEIVGFLSIFSLVEVTSGKILSLRGHFCDRRNCRHCRQKWMACAPKQMPRLYPASRRNGGLALRFGAEGLAPKLRRTAPFLLSETNPLCWASFRLKGGASERQLKGFFLSVVIVGFCTPGAWLLWLLHFLNSSCFVVIVVVLDGDCRIQNVILERTVVLRAVGERRSLRDFSSLVGNSGRSRMK